MIKEYINWVKHLVINKTILVIDVIFLLRGIYILSSKVYPRLYKKKTRSLHEFAEVCGDIQLLLQNGGTL